MKQMQVKPDSIIEVPLTGAAKALKPVVFREGKGFCALLGPNPQEGVMGCAFTPKAALKDWDARLQDHLATAGEDNEVVKYVRGLLTSSNQDGDKQVPKHIQEFYDQFRPVKKQ